ncbi:MAG: hypothetical protein WBG08_04860 [Litorimonas sp.]
MFLPPLIMLAVTVTVVTLLFLPATFERKSALVNFYWVGVWLFLGLIAAISGAEQTVMLAGLPQTDLAQRLLTSSSLCFVIFVVFGWFRLSGVALLLGLRRIAKLA